MSGLKNEPVEAGVVCCCVPNPVVPNIGVVDVGCAVDCDEENSENDVVNG